MTRRVEYAQIEATLDDLTYPVLRDDAAANLDDVTLVLSDGEENLGVLISETDSDAFRTRDDLVLELAETVDAPMDEHVHAADAGGEEE